MDEVADTRVKLSKDIARIAGTISIALSLIATISFTNASNSGSYSSELSAVEELFDSDSLDSNFSDESWVPAGFKAWIEDSNIAWRWANKNNCNEYGCVTAEFISRYGCPSGLYVALNWLDGNDSVVGYTNETLPSLLPSQNAKLTFEDYEDSSESGQISSIRCN
jgi:hypothetical protein